MHANSYYSIYILYMFVCWFSFVYDHVCIDMYMNIYTNISSAHACFIVACTVWD